MSSFRRKVFRPYILGTKTSPQTGQVVTVSGNPALDELLGGGLPMNSIILIEEDKYSTYSKVLCKYFLAEGVVQKQLLFLACLDENPEDIIKKLPQPVFRDVLDNAPSEQELQEVDTTSLRIAWRYNDLPYLNAGKTNTLGMHYFNLLNFMTPQRIANATTVLWNGEETDTETASEDENQMQQDSDYLEDNPMSKEYEDTSTPPPGTSLFTNKRFQQLLEAITKETQSIEFCRICIPSLGSPLWYDDDFGQDLLKFLTVLRAIVQSTQSVCFLTMPMHLIAKNDETLVPKIRNLVDYSIELESFAGSDRETNPAFKQYNGLLHFRKMSAINSLALIQHSDLAFKLRRKTFVIEKFHLPPDLDVIAEQDTEDGVSKTATVGCGGAVNNLDF